MAGGRVELISLTKRFTEIAVDSIDLTIASGEFFSLLGPSGCGKTTTLRLIAGFEQPTAGRILLDERRRVEHPAAQAQRQHGLPELRAVPVPHRVRQRRVRAPQPARGQEGDRAPGQRGAGPGAPAPVREAPARPAVRRPAAAGGPGPGPGAAARGAAARRAARRARRQAAPLAQGRAEGAAGAGRHHLPVRHARPGGSAHHVRPAGGDARRQDRPAGRPARGLRGARGHLRGRLPGRLQPDAGGRHLARPRAPAARSSWASPCCWWSTAARPCRTGRTP